MTADGKFPTWVKPGARAVSSIHGPGHVTYTSGVYIGFHFDDNRRDEMTDCWYSDETGDGRFTSGFGIDELTPEKGEMK